jgi:uncharacterized protein (TIGR02271 family)
VTDRVDQLQPLSTEKLSFEEAASSDSNILTAYGLLDESKAETEFCFPDGKTLRVPTSVLLDAASRLNASRTVKIPTQIQTVVPVLEECLEVGRRTIETGKILLEKHVHEYEEVLNEPLVVRTFDVERVPFNQVIQSPPPIRYEGEMTIYPLVEERLVLTKELVLREELRVTRRDTEMKDTRSIILQRESVTVSRIPATAEHP